MLKLSEKKIAFVTNRFPFPPIKGDQVVLHNRLKYLADHNVECTVFVNRSNKENFQNPYNESITFKFQANYPTYKKLYYALRGAIASRPLEVSINHNPALEAELENFDLIIFTLFRSVGLINLNRTNIVVDAIDSLAVNYRMRFSTERSILNKIVFFFLYIQMKKFEVLANKSRVSLVADADRVFIKNAQINPLGVSSEFLSCQPFDNFEEHLGMGFFGNMQYTPNAYALRWIEENADYFNKNLPFKIHVAGTGLEGRRSDRNNYVVIDGFQQDIVTWISRLKYILVPIFQGTGMQNKVIQGFASGRVTLLTMKAAEPLNLPRDILNLISFETKQDLVARIRNFEGDDMLYRQVAAELKSIARSKFGWNKLNDDFFDWALK